MAAIKLSPKGTYLVLVLASTFLQGSSFVSTKVIISDVPPLWTAAARFLVAALTLIPVVIIQMRKAHLKLANLPWGKLLVIGALQTAGVMAFLNMGLVSIAPPTAAIIMASNPLLVIILARLFLHERSSLSTILGMIIAFTGVVICIGIPDGRQEGTGVMLVILASTCWACATVFNKKCQLPLSPWIITFWQMLLGSLILSAAAALGETAPALPSTPYHWLMFLWLAIPASTGAMGLWFAALRLGGSVQTSGFLFLCPLFAALIAFMLYGQTPTTHQLFGALIIAAGLVAMSRRR
ncbi:DMT family transporter [Pluralibacter gergoviae]